MRCRGSPRRLRLREAFAVRPLAGAFEEQQRARRPTDPDPLAPKRRKFCTTPPDTACTAQLNAFPGRESSCVAEPCGGVGGPATVGTHRPAFAWGDRRPWRPHGGGKPPQSIRCRDSPRRLRGRKAFGVRPLAGAFGPPHCYRRPPAPRLPSRLVPHPTLFVPQPTTFSLKWPASVPPQSGCTRPAASA